MDGFWLQLLELAVIISAGAVVLVVTAYALAWAVASGWARGRQAVPTPEQDYQHDMDRLASGGW